MGRQSNFGEIYFHFLAAQFAYWQRLSIIIKYDLAIKSNRTEHQSISQMVANQTMEAGGCGSGGGIKCRFAGGSRCRHRMWPGC